MQRPLAIFDIDGTLFQTHLATTPAVQRVFAQNGLETPSEAFIMSFTGKPVREFHEWIIQQAGEEKGASLVEEVDRLELELVSAEAKLFPGICDAMAALREKGWTLAACSNGPTDYVNAVLDGHALRPLFAAVRFHGMGYSGKTEMVRETLAQFGHGKQVGAAVMIGDRNDDVEAARATSMRAIGCAYGYGAEGELEGADAVVLRPSQIPAAVERLFRTDGGPPRKGA